MSRARDNSTLPPSRIPPRLSKDWASRLKASGFRDIEYTDGSLLGISLSEADRAPDAADVDATREYYSMATEYLHAHDWTRQRTDRRVWELYADALPQREIASRLGVGVATVHRRLGRLRAAFAAWWDSTSETRRSERSGRGRPRKEYPRREQLKVRLTRDELVAIRSGAHRAGAERAHEVAAWVRWVLIEAAKSQPP